MGKVLPELESLDVIVGLMKGHQVHTLIFKRLAPNDNSKNQIYLGGDYSALQLLPFGNVYADKSRKDSKRDRFKADLHFNWMNNVGKLYEAPSAQLILYPKYPEVRMSGFLKGSECAPSNYLTCRDEGRVMLLGITEDRRIIGHIIGPNNPVSSELETYDSDAVFNVIFKDRLKESTKHQLITKLKEIHELGWVNSCKLDKEGVAQPYRAQNGGGYTLEALLGVLPNGLNEPDYMGWEVKQHNCKLNKPLSGGAITLMTPEPTGGFYKDMGVINFVQNFGYPDTKGREDRYNFGGVHKFNIQQARTKLTLELVGYDTITDKITDINGGITLRSEDGVEAAIWHYSSLLEKWNRKHSQAVYVPSNKQTENGVQYYYGNVVALGIGTDFGKFLSAMAARSIYYDPGIKVENISTVPKAKKRSQFRIRPISLPTLYDEMELVDLLEH